MSTHNSQGEFAGFSEYTDRLNMREQLARIDRTLAEHGKLREEEDKLRSERLKYDAEALKLASEWLKHDAEALKLRRDPAETAKRFAAVFLAPALALAAMLGAIATVAPSLIRWLNMKLGVS